MAKILVQCTHGPEAATRTALAFLLAKAAVEEGHEVSLFLAGDAVQLIRDDVRGNVNGVGTGNVGEWFDGFVAGGGRLFLSRMSSNARGIGDADLEGKPAQFVTPPDVVRLTLEHDRVLTY